MECNKCKELTEWYKNKYPEKNGYALCEPCYEKSKEHFVYMKLPYAMTETETYEISREELPEV